MICGAESGDPFRRIMLEELRDFVRIATCGGDTRMPGRRGCASVQSPVTIRPLVFVIGGDGTRRAYLRKTPVSGAQYLPS